MRFHRLSGFITISGFYGVKNVTVLLCAGHKPFWIGMCIDIGDLMNPVF